MDTPVDAPALPAEAAADTPLGESPWPPIVTVLIFMAVDIALRIWLPRSGLFRVPWPFPTVEAGLLLVLLTSDPTGPAERRRLRRVPHVLVGLLRSPSTSRSPSS